MSSACSVIINQQQPAEKIVEVSKKHPVRVAQGHKLAALMRERKLGIAPPKKEPMTFREFLRYFERDLNTPDAILKGIKETLEILEDQGLYIHLVVKKK